MTFYLMPPRGTIPLTSLMKDAETRLLYLCQLHQRWGDDEKIRCLLHDHPNLAYNSDCLIEGSDKDCATFYMLKLASLGDEKFQVFLTETEAYFFEHRLLCGGERTIKNTISEALTHSHYALGNVYLTRAQHIFIPQLVEVLRNLVEDGMNECADRKLCCHSIKVPWTLILPLVRTRSVALVAGQAVVECQQVVQLLCCLFKTLFVLGLRQLDDSKVDEDIQDDERTAPIIKILYRLYRTHHVGKIMRPLKYLHHKEIEKEARYFPLCMQELHKVLKHHNRLRHYERYRFSLYLKDIGLPLDENIAFWESYYTKPHRSDTGGCQHAWKGCKNRYSYSIRHMYGLEGRKMNCASHSCSSLQRLQPNPQERGGCPFSSYSPSNLTPLLLPLLGPNMHIQEAIAKEMKTGRPTAACKILMAFTLRKMQHQISNTTPESGLKQVPHHGTGEQPQRLLSSGCDECHHNTGLAGSEAVAGSSTTGTQRKACGTIQIPAMGVNGLCSTKGSSRGSTVHDTGCISTKNTSGESFICDIEDITAMMPQCLYNRPSQYYLRVVSTASSSS